MSEESIIEKIIKVYNENVDDSEWVKDARAEFAQLRATVKEAHDAHVYLDESCVNDPDASPLELAERIAGIVGELQQLRAAEEKHEREYKEWQTTIEAALKRIDALEAELKIYQGQRALRQ